MMTSRTLWIRSISALILVVSSLNVAAYDCNEKSPTFKKEGDNYFNFHDAKPLTTEQRTDIKRIFSSLKKRLRGEGVVTLCEDIEGKTIKVVSKEKLSAEVELQSNGHLSIQLDVYNRHNKISDIESLNYFSKTDHLSFISKAPNSFSFSYKIRNFNRRGVNVFKEKFVTLSVNDGVLTIHTLNFYFGYFVSSTKRTLHP